MLFASIMDYKNKFNTSFVVLQFMTQNYTMIL